LADENYKANGWLGLIVGKSVYLQCYAVQMVDGVLPLFLQRLKPTSPLKALKPVVPLATPSTATSSSAKQSPELMDMLKSMQAQLTALTVSVAEIKSDVKKLMDKKQ